MDKSDSINELATALAKAQGAIRGAEKSRENPAFRSRYSTLDDIWEACREPLSANGLAVVQAPVTSEPGTVALSTTLLHSSGQWIGGLLVVPVTKQDAQGYGSALTYARRYSLAALVGVCSDDDDGNAAVGNAQGKPQQRQQAARQESRPNGAAPRPEARQQPAAPPQPHPTAERAVTAAEHQTAMGAPANGNGSHFTPPAGEDPAAHKAAVSLISGLYRDSGRVLTPPAKFWEFITWRAGRDVRSFSNLTTAQAQAIAEWLREEAATKAQGGLGLDAPTDDAAAPAGLRS